MIAWAMPTLHPDRTAGVIGVNTPHVPFPATQALKLIAQDDPDRLYILWFQQPGVAEGVLDGQTRQVFEKLMRRPESAENLLSGRDGAGKLLDMNPFRRLPEFEPAGATMLSDAEIDVYTRAFQQSGFRGGINWYRNIDRNQTAHPEVGVQAIEHPCLMVTAEWDAVLPPAMAASMPERIDDLDTIMIEKCGHWTQQDKPAELSRIMLNWLTRRFL